MERITSSIITANCVLDSLASSKAAGSGKKPVDDSFARIANTYELLSIDCKTNFSDVYNGKRTTVNNSASPSLKLDESYSYHLRSSRRVRLIV